MSGYFEGHFESPNAQDLGTLTLRPLHSPITPEGGTPSIEDPQNHHAYRTDMIPNELLKYGGLALAENIAGILNAIFETGEVIIGQGVLIPLQKPDKAKEELKSLRPVVLLNSIRKVFSLVVFERICEQVDDTSQPSRVLSGRAIQWPTLSLLNMGCPTWCRIRSRSHTS